MSGGIVTWIVEKERSWRNSFGDDISTPEARRKTMWHFRYLDHGVLRVFWHNFVKLDDNVFRSNQPSPQDLEKYRDLGVKTIVNLRGKSPYSQYLLEKEACADLGLRLVNVKFSAHKAPRRKRIRKLLRIFETFETPMLLHCKSGADRTGLAAVIYMMVVKNATFQEASQQLHWRYLHFRWSTTGVLDYFFEQYEMAYQETGISFVDWVMTSYNRRELQRAYKIARRQK